MHVDLMSMPRPVVSIWDDKRWKYIHEVSCLPALYAGVTLILYNNNYYHYYNFDNKLKL